MSAQVYGEQPLLSSWVRPVTPYLLRGGTVPGALPEHSQQQILWNKTSLSSRRLKSSSTLCPGSPGNPSAFNVGHCHVQGSLRRALGLAPGALEEHCSGSGDGDGSGGGRSWISKASLSSLIRHTPSPSPSRSTPRHTSLIPARRYQPGLAAPVVNNPCLLLAEPAPPQPGQAGPRTCVQEGKYCLERQLPQPDPCMASGQGKRHS